MPHKPRSPGKTAISVSLDKTTLDRIDKRCRQLGIARSQYLRLLAQHDTDTGGDLTIKEHLIRPKPDAR